MARQNFDGTEASVDQHGKPRVEATGSLNAHDTYKVDDKNVCDCDAHVRDAREAELKAFGYALRFDPDTGITWKIDQEGNRIGKHEVRTYTDPADQSPAELLLDILKLTVQLFHQLSDEPLPRGTLTRLYQELAESLPKEDNA